MKTTIQVASQMYFPDAAGACVQVIRCTRQILEAQETDGDATRDLLAVRPACTSAVQALHAGCFGQQTSSV